MLTFANSPELQHTSNLSRVCQQQYQNLFSIYSNSSNRILFNREVEHKYNTRFYNWVAFKKDRLRCFDRTDAVIEHNGCINTAMWNNLGDKLYTGSDDRKIKIWQLSGNYDDVKLLHTIQTRHRGNIFCASPSPINENLVLSAAADGYIRANYVDNPNATTPLLSSDEIM
jgi:WD40 repeat protein